MALTPLVAISDADGSWAALKAEWEAECRRLGEDIEGYAPGTFAALDPLAAETRPDAGIYALRDEQGATTAICQLNRTPLPGYDGPVLRVRFMTYAPRYDFTDYKIEDYAAVIVGLFYGVVLLSMNDLQARYIKFHLPSPADRTFFGAVGMHLEGSVPIFEEVAVKGSWLYVTKAK